MEARIIRITRKSEFAYAARRLAVMVDGNRIGFVGNGKTADFELPPGRHDVWVSLDWVRSRACQVDMSEPALVELKTKLSGGFLGAVVKPYYNPHGTYELSIVAVRKGEYFRPAN